MYTTKKRLDKRALNGCVETNLIPILEAIGYCLFRAVDSHLNAIQYAVFNSLSKSLPSEPENADRRIAQPWGFSPSIQSKVNLVWNLGGDLMISKFCLTDRRLPMIADKCSVRSDRI